MHSTAHTSRDRGGNSQLPQWFYATNHLACHVTKVADWSHRYRYKYTVDGWTKILGSGRDWVIWSGSQAGEAFT